MDAINVFHPAVSEHFTMQTESQYNLFSPRDRGAFVFGGEAGGFEVRGEGGLKLQAVYYFSLGSRACAIREWHAPPENFERYVFWNG